MFRPRIQCRGTSRPQSAGPATPHLPCRQRQIVSSIASVPPPQDHDGSDHQMADASPWEDLFVPIFPSSALLWVSDPKICAASIKPRVVRAITWPDDWRYPNPGIFQLNGFRPSSLALRRKLPPYRVAGIANRFIRVCPASPSSHIFATGIKAFSRSGRTKYFGEMLIYSSSPQKQGFSRWFFMDSRLRGNDKMD